MRQGAFRFENVPAKPLRENVAKANPLGRRGRGQAILHCLATPGCARNKSKPLTITLAPEAKVTGRVTDQHGKPIPNATVTLNSIDPLAAIGHAPRMPIPATLILTASRLAPAAKTDADGRVTFACLPRDARLSFGVGHSDFQRSGVLVAITDRPQPEIEVPGVFDGARSEHKAKIHAGTFSVALAPGLPRWVGRITAADTNKPLSRVLVSVQKAVTTTDQEGRFVLQDIGDSRCRVVVYSPKGSDYLGRVVFADAARDKKETQVDIALDRGQIVSGRVVDDETGKGVAGVGVALVTGFDVNTTTIAGPLPSGDRTDGEGRFRLVVPPGKGKVKIWKDPGELRGYSLPGHGGLSEDIDGFFKEIEVIAGKPTADVKFTVRRTAAKAERPLLRGGEFLVRPEIDGSPSDRLHDCGGHGDRSARQTRGRGGGGFVSVVWQ